MYTLDDLLWAAIEVSTRPGNPAGIGSVGIWYDTVQVDYYSGVTLVVSVPEGGERIRITIYLDMEFICEFTWTSLDTFKYIVQHSGKVVEVDV